MKIWYVHPYAGGPGVGRHWRPYGLASQWLNQGAESVIFSAGYHHLLEPDVSRRGRVTHADVPYRFIPTLRYRGNGLGRIVSMTIFALRLPFSGWREKRLHGGPDLIVYSSPHPFGFLTCWLMARLLGARLFFEVRDLWPLSLIEIARMSPRHPLAVSTALIERFAYRYADKVISLLPNAETYMLERGLPPGKFAWISNGIGTLELNATRDSRASGQSKLARQVAFLASSGRIVFVYAGAHGEPNALHHFLDSAVILKHQGFDRAVFLLIGKGDQRVSLMDRVQRESLDFVHFYDQQPKEEVLAVLRQADAAFFVMHPLGIYRFGISLNKLFDYMSCSVPIVAAYSAGNDPIAEAGCGIAVAAGDPHAYAEALKRFCNLSPEERTAMGRRGRVAVEKQYSYEALAHRYLEEFQACRSQ